MPTETRRKLSELFRVKAGDYHAKQELDVGAIPLISCGVDSNGLVGYYDIAPEKTYQNSITVAFNGTPLTAKLHLYRFGAKDDVAVLIPLRPLRGTTLLYVAALLNRMTWRYSYGRKCFRAKLENVALPIPLTVVDGVITVDEDTIAAYAPQNLRGVFEANVNRVLETIEGV